MDIILKPDGKQFLIDNCGLILVMFIPIVFLKYIAVNRI